jgi:hypothetical protein
MPHFINNQPFIYSLQSIFYKIINKKYDYFFKKILLKGKISAIFFNICTLNGILKIF